MKKKLLPLALAAAAGFTGVTAQAQTMVQNHDGTGQLLMYPIYTANGGNDTYISVANTTADYKAVKVRFVDAMNSQDSLDFHLYLSPQDHWSGVVTKEGDGAVLKTGDTSCTVPNILAASAVGQLGTTAPMRTFKYGTGGAEADAINNGLDRTLEGHVEIIEMGVVPAASASNGVAQLAPGSGSATAGAAGDSALVLRSSIKHVNGVPGNCANLETAWRTGGAFFYTDQENTPGDAKAATHLQLDAPTGGLYGYGVIINVPDGTAAMFDAVAVDGFMDDGYHPTPGDDEPGVDDGVDNATVYIGDSTATNAATYQDFDGAAAAVLAANGVGTTPVAVTGLEHVDPQRGKTGSRFAGGGNSTVTATTAGNDQEGSLQALSALLTRATVANDYVLEPGLNAATDWVITFPTKRDFVNLSAAAVAANPFGGAGATAGAATDAPAPFTSQWDHSKTEACEQIAISYWDREEGVNVITSGFDFSPAPVTTPDVLALCTESNILNFNSKGVLGGSSRITKSITLANGFNNGWARVSFGVPGAGGTVTAPELSDGSEIVKGLPVIGFAIQKYVNNSATSAGALANYAGSIGHHFTNTNDN
ncbi:hypothetical protein HBA56_14895 [Pseudoteredinibacter isoporae]|nr:hypothetical protein [Pseudoteredinibacter isoporae]NIB24970.1 hypothetical protein [Pseudoteredinibacter isoporae]